MQLVNDLVRFEFSDQSGVLRQVQNLQSGQEYLLDPEGAALFWLTVPAGEWDSRYIDAAAQQCTINRSEHRLTIHYNHLIAVDGEKHPIELTVTVDLPDGSHEAFFQMSIRNDGIVPITEVWFPRFGGWNGLAGPGKDSLTVGAVPLDPHEFAVDRSWTTFGCRHNRVSQHFPHILLPWMDISGDGAGLWLINYMQTARIGGFSFENQKRHEAGLSLASGWFSHPEISAGQTWESSVFGLGVHQSDWHATAKHYREWLETWWKPAEVPDRVRRSLGSQAVIFTQFDGAPVRGFDKIPEVAAAGVKYGIHDLSIWDHAMLGNYAGTSGRMNTDYPEEQWEALRKGLAGAHELGVSVNALVNHRVVSQTCDFWLNGGHKGALRLRDGSVRAEAYPVSAFGAEWDATWRGPQSLIMCQRSKEFRESFLKHLDLLLEVGFDSMFIDQPCEYLPCYALNHGHISPDDTHQAVVEWIREFRGRLKAKYPDGYIIGEGGEIFVGEVIDVWWHWMWYRGRPDITAYSVPKMVNGYVTDRNILKAQAGFLHGFQLMFTTKGLEGTLDDVPEFARFIKKLAALREKTAHCTTFAQFEDEDGLTFSEGVKAKRFQTNDGADAIIIINPEEKAQTVKVSLTGVESNGGKLHRLDGSTSKADKIVDRVATLDLALAPLEVDVWEV